MPGKVTKPLFLLRNSVSVFQLGIGAQRAKILTTNLQTRPGSDHRQVAPQATQLDRTLLDLSPPQPLFSRRVGRLEDFSEVRPSGFPCCRTVLGSHPIFLLGYRTPSLLQRTGERSPRNLHTPYPCQQPHPFETGKNMSVTALILFPYSCLSI